MTARPALGSLHDDLAAVLSRAARRHGVPGAQLAVRRGQETVTVQTGELRHDSGVAVRSDDAFPVGSITKSFTAALAMVLVGEGELELDGPIGEHLTGLGAAAGEVTLRQLLSHTAGLPSGRGSEELHGVALRTYLAEHCGPDQLVLPPGGGFSYSNVGYVLAGHLVEHCTGMRWAEAMQSILLRPLGITASFVGTATPAPARRTAAGHAVGSRSGLARPVEQSLSVIEMAAGGLALSAADLVQFGALYVGDGRPDVLPAALAREMREPVPQAEPSGLADGWALGLAVYRHGWRRYVGHDGNAAGTACYLRIDPGDGGVAALTCNAGGGAQLWRDLTELLDRHGIPAGDAESSPAGRTGAEPDYLGVYRNGDTEYELAAHEGDTRLVVDGEPLGRVAVRRDLTFAVEDPGAGAVVAGGRLILHPGRREVQGIRIGGRFAVRRSVRPRR